MSGKKKISIVIKINSLMIMKTRSRLDFNLIRKRIRSKGKISLSRKKQKIAILIDLINRKMNKEIYQENKRIKTMISKWKEKRL